MNGTCYLFRLFAIKSKLVCWRFVNKDLYLGVLGVARLAGTGNYATLSKLLAVICIQIVERHAGPE